MSNIRANIKLVTPIKTIEKKIMLSIERHLKKKLPKIQTLIKKEAQALIIKSLENSPSDSALTSGDLRSELGIPNPVSELSNIYHAISKTVDIKFSMSRATTKGVKITITLSAVPFDLGYITSKFGTYETKKGASIPWLEWLTTYGDKIIVRDYIAESGHPKYSRTGDKIMLKGKSGWRVPPAFSGTDTNNFVTRATDSILPELGNKIQKLIEGNI